VAADSGWKYPPVGVPSKPEPSRSSVPLSEAAQRLSVDRRTLLAAVTRGDTAGWARRQRPTPAGMTMSQAVQAGYDVLAPIPSCVLMFKQELPLLFSDDVDVRRVANAMFDPFQYLMLRHRAGKLRTDFSRPLGKVAYHVACHLRVQNIGQKTRELLELIPDTKVESIERCAGHNGTYGVRREFHDIAMRIGRPVMQRIDQSECDYYASDCPLAGHHLGQGLSNRRPPTHPLRLVRMAYGLEGPAA